MKGNLKFRPIGPIRKPACSARSALTGCCLFETKRFLPEYRLSYGIHLWNAGRRDEALGHFEWYASVQPARFQGRFYAGASLRFLGRPREALAHLEAAVRLEPQRADAWNELGRARADVGDRAGADEAFERARALE